MSYNDMELDLSKARLNQARECLRAARALLEIEDYRGAANRSYYSVFHAMRAVLTLDGIDRKHHSGIITEFRRLYIKQMCLTRFFLISFMLSQNIAHPATMMISL